MKVKLVLKKKTGKEVVMPVFCVETKELLQQYMQGYLTCYASFRKSRVCISAYDLSSGELVETIYV